MLDLLLPQRCVVCDRGGSQFCDSCRNGLRRLAPPFCERCGRPTEWPVARCKECSGRRIAFAVARAAVAYDDVARRLVHSWKERGLRRLAVVTAEITASQLAWPDVDAVTFVPADPTRRLARGHNPAERLADELALLWELPCEPLLERIRGDRQRGRSGHERRSLRGAFRATGSGPRRVVLVDDVYTTGTTVSACSTALRSAGARRVEVVTFARTLLRT